MSSIHHISDLQFTLKSPIKVMRVDLLKKGQGVSELYRNTLAKAVMRGDGSFLIIWAGEYLSASMYICSSSDRQRDKIPSQTFLRFQTGLWWPTYIQSVLYYVLGVFSLNAA